MAFFMSKAKKEEQARAAEDAKREAEFNAKYAAKTERKNVEKIVTEMDQSLVALKQKAAEAKSKGYEDVYRQQVYAIKIAMGRKAQAEKFLFQMDTMQMMQKISGSSERLLDSMNNIMSTLGKLSLDPTAMRDAQRNFAETQKKLESQSAAIERGLDGTVMTMPSDEELGADVSDAAIDAEIEAMILNGQISTAAAPAGTAANNSDSAVLNELRAMAN